MAPKLDRNGIKGVESLVKTLAWYCIRSYQVLDQQALERWMKTKAVKAGQIMKNVNDFCYDNVRDMIKTYMTIKDKTNTLNLGDNHKTSQ